jgi:hypothetical protein
MGVAAEVRPGQEQTNSVGKIMNSNIAKCDGKDCGKFNTSGETGWVKTIAVIPGPTPRHPLRQAALDFCPSCAAKTTVSELPTLAPQLAVAANPRAGAPGVSPLAVPQPANHEPNQ